MMNNTALLYPESPNNVMGLGSMIFQSTLDVAFGNLIARTSEAIFDNSWTDLYLESADNEDGAGRILTKKTLRVFLQLVFNVVVSYEVRSLYEPVDRIDPLGGMFFIYAVGNQPSFWKKVKELGDEVYNRLVLEANYAGKIKQ